MAGAASPPTAPEPGSGEPWRTVAQRVRLYLEAAALEPEAACALAEQVTRTCAAAQPELGENEAILSGLRAARRTLAQQAAADLADKRALAPQDRPLSIRRRGFRSFMDWRLATSRLRRLLPARAPQRLRQQPGPRSSAHIALSGAARLRRAMFAVLILTTAFWGVGTFVEILGVDGLSYLDITQSVVFAILLLWLAQSFWTLAAGAAVLAKRLLLGHRPAPPPAHAGPPPRVAVIAPIYNEGTERVFAGLRAMWEDLVQQPQAERIDLFVLSDTTDPDIWLDELDAWQRLRENAPQGQRIFYRRRLRNVKRKTGNIEDFVTRWGGAYGYMIVLDADSLMAGEAMNTLVERMDANPEVGLIQAPPKLIRGHTVFARVLQFAGEVYGPLSVAGISYWALGEGNYWGHNAIIRVAPFAELCGLPLLPGRAPLGGEILSHDFVEAALLRRGGWQVWIADDVEASYEEPPPSIADFATRDRRWCQGNMQHIKVLFVRDLHWVSRLHLCIGILSYVTSPLWLLFLLLSAAQAWELAYGQPVYFTAGLPFPTLPVSVSAEAAALLGITLGLLFLPKLFGLVLAMVDGPRRRALGGVVRLCVSTVLETLYSALQAPVMMLFHTNFVLTILLGSAIEWTPQRRQVGGSMLAETVRRFGWTTLIGLGAALATWIYTPPLFYWLTPVLGGLVLSIPLAMLGASERWGERLRKAGLLLIVEERRPPRVVQRLEELLRRQRPAAGDRFAQAVLDPGFNALHIAMLRAIGGQPGSAPESLRPIERKAVYLGAAALSKPERRALLEHAGVMARLHLAAWLHWRSERGLSWETEEALPPIPRAGEDGNISAAA
ncbi:MAG: glucans biosynthesis glucosyltransferase MdoH [Geminicoccaceae bacterium]